ncbi:MULTISPECIES: hypothetical protein [unclassified Curtobacterium]|uniref:hypothetical protein n=1 Tax=unclassified Curtobacterium TaxID=257496 RepID=UPI000DA86DB9|nr:MULTISPECIES: hypothetical protein [unclassified Curtobacterium]PZE64202.1 hypothetical protein DEJ12_16965 [Curtobacterium sp. MCLR17_059]PZF45699.1 hypothetical protein DEJ10_17370 [Curtobacterium sp. MCLR17_057]
MTTATEAPETPEAIARRAWRRTAVIVTIGVVLGAVGGSLFARQDSTVETTLAIVGIAAGVGGLLGTLSMLTTTLRRSSDMQAPIDGLSRFGRKTLAQAIASGTPLEPTDSDLARRAFALARLRAAYQPVALGQFLLLYVGIAGPQIPNLFDDNSFVAGLSRIICGALLVVAAAMSPVILRQTRAARRYVQAAPEAAARQR